MTLPEVLVTVTIAMILSLATFALVDTAMRRSGEINARVETVQRGRLAMDAMTRQLRSQMCLGVAPARSVIAASGNSVTFYAYMGDPSTKASQVLPTATATPIIPEKRQLSFEGDAIVERRWTGVPSTTDPLGYTFPTNPTATRTLLKPAALVETGNPAVAPTLFNYFAYNVATQDTSFQLGAGGAALSDLQMRQIVQIKLQYRALPSVKRPDGRASTVLKNDVSSRTFDPNDPDRLIPCQ